MHNNHYLLRQLAPRLREIILKSELISCYSQRKDELVLTFQREKEFVINASLRGEFTCLHFPAKFKRASKNTINIFNEAIGRRVSNVICHKNERNLSIGLQDFTVVLKLHGNRSNALLFKDNELRAVFKQNISGDYDLKKSDLDKKINQTFEAFQKHNCDFKKVFPTFGKVVENYLHHEGYFKLSDRKKWQLLEIIRENLENPTFYLTYFRSKPALSLLEFEDAKVLGDDPVYALNIFYLTYTKVYFLEKEKAVLIRQAEKRLKSCTIAVQKSRARLKELTGKSAYEQTANIIMANLHQLSRGMEKALLHDFYSDRQVEIKLNKNLSPQKNAEKFYRKAKNQKIEVANLQKVIQKNLKERKKMENLVMETQEAGNFNDIKKIKKKFGLAGNGSGKTSDVPYREYQVMNYRILIGKNAKSNETLLHNFAWKEDLWLHAKDVSGSHVVVKHQAGKNYPDPVKEVAAQLAAWFSKGKTNTLCPVICTPRKHVYKPKGAAIGEVSIKREEVLIVPPKSPDQLNIN